MSSHQAIVCFLLCTSLIPLRSSLAAEEKTSFPDPVEKQIEGWTVDVDPQLFSKEHAALGRNTLDALANHLQRVKYIVPPERVAALQKFRIWVDLQHAELDKMQYHPSRAWLEAHGYDPRLAQHVHIPVARQLLNRNMWAQHPCIF